MDKKIVYLIRKVKEYRTILTIIIVASAGVLSLYRVSAQDSKRVENKAKSADEIKVPDVNDATKNELGELEIKNLTSLSVNDLVLSILGPGVSFSNVKYQGSQSSAGTFTGGDSIIGFDNGIILGTGNVKDVKGPNLYNDTGTDLKMAGDLDLSNLVKDVTKDATVLEFDFTPVTDQLTFQYVFSSEEYNEFVNSPFNDVFAFFLNGTNVALLPGGNLPVSINNVNGGNPYGKGARNSQFYRNNTRVDPGPATINTEMDGLTIVFSIQAKVIVGQVNHIKLAIADVRDEAYDSHIFIRFGSFTAIRNADLALIQTSSQTEVLAGNSITYTLALSNNGPDNAQNIYLNDGISSKTTFQSLTAPSGWICDTPVTGVSDSINCKNPSFPAYATAFFELTVKADGDIVNGDNIITTAYVFSGTPDNLGTNNIATSLPVKALVGNAVMTTNTLTYPTAVVTRAPNTGGPSQSFTIANNGGAPLILTYASLRRAQANAQVTALDEFSFFSLFLQNPNGSETRLNFGSTVTLQPNQAQQVRLAFTPTYPPLALRVTNLPAFLVLPTHLNAQLIFTQNTGLRIPPPPLALNLTASVTGLAKLIHPTDATLPPLVTLRLVNDQFEAECFVHDPNLNINLVRFEFLDNQDRRVVPPTDVTITPQDFAAVGLVPGQSLNLLQRFLQASRYPTMAKVRVTIYDSEGSDTATSGAVLPATAATATVSAASYQAEALASEGIASAFGQRLALTTQSATTLPLPTALHGTQVRVKDSTGTERFAPLFFVSPAQINFLIPTGTAAGTATVTVYNGEGAISAGTAQINATGPGLFTANADGKGVVAGTVVRVAPTGARSYDTTSQLVGTQFVAKPIVMGNDQIFLELYGTGWRNHANLNGVAVTVGGVSVPVLYAGQQPTYVGVDQVNIQLPHALVGKGEVELQFKVNGKPANTVKLHVQ